MSTVQNESVKILNGTQLTPHFQPIVSFSKKKIIGYQGLIYGPSDSPLSSPSASFDAEHLKLNVKLERISWEITVKRYAGLNVKGKLFFNVSLPALLQPDFKKKEILKLLNQFDIDPSAVVIGLSEDQTGDDSQLMSDAVAHCRNTGLKVAVNYLGEGNSSVRRWPDFRPDYIKIDRHLIHGIHNDTINLNFVQSIQNIANSFNCSVIAEGIETADEFKTVAQLGIILGRGGYFAEPVDDPVKKIDKSLFIVSNAPDKFSGTKAAHIIKLIAPISAETAISEVMSLFQHNEDLTILPLVDNDEATGIIFRDLFLSRLFSSRYGMDLYGKHPIKSFLGKAPLLVEQNTPIELVSKRLTSKMRDDPAFIITHEGAYKGIGTTLDLLEEITRQQIHNAKHANPLTLLPGSIPINDQVNQLLASKIPFSFGYFDLDHFKPFNDVYGYSAGDDIIKAVADILTQHISAENGRVGHIGGDDFIVIFLADDWLECCESILAAFKAAVPRYYTDEDINAGGIHTENRAGEKCFFPMISLSVGLLAPNLTCQCHSHVDLADLASEAKKQAKKIEGNSFFINRRIAGKSQENR